MRGNRTYFAKPLEVKPGWRVIDAEGQTLGRLAAQISRMLQGKDKPTYTPHVLCGDHVVVVNAARVRVTGKKLEQKVYYRHSGYVGHLKAMALKELLEKHPERVILLAVKGMLPSTELGREMFRRLRVYAGEAPEHQRQLAEKQEER